MILRLREQLAVLLGEEGSMEVFENFGSVGSASASYRVRGAVPGAEAVIVADSAFA